MKQKLQQLFISSRPISWINTSYPFAAGYLLTTRKIDATLIIGSLFFLIPYNVMMYGVNDVFDYESDLHNPRKGGLEGALLKKANHRFILGAVTVVNLPFVIVLLYRSSTLGDILLLLDVSCVLAYSLPKLRFKERPFLDSLTSALHFCGPLIYALSFGSYTSQDFILISAFILWGMASHAFGAAQDIIADRAAMIGSVGTVIGAKRTVQLSMFLYLLCAGLLLSVGWAGVIPAILALLYMLNIYEFRDLSDALAEQANRGWKRFLKLNYLSGFVITLLIIGLYRHW